MTKKIAITIILGIFLLFAEATQAANSTDQKCLALTIYKEAGGEPLKGQYAIGEIVLNRIRAGFASTPCAVINQHNGNHWQFESHKFLNPVIPKNRIKYFYSIAQTILDGNSPVKFPNNVLYFNNRIFDHKRYKLYCRIGKQMFFTKS
jgi:N-acetylmuramoyl-L-alanine amidase